MICQTLEEEWYYMSDEERDKFRENSLYMSSLDNELIKLNKDILNLKQEIFIIKNTRKKPICTDFSQIEKRKEIEIEKEKEKKQRGSERVGRTLAELSKAMKIYKKTFENCFEH